MKKIYTLITASVFTFMNVSAATFNVSVGATGINLFSPNSFNANIGDDVIFTLASGSHSVVNTSVPSGAASFSSGSMTTVGQMYTYNITVAGNYFYHCGVHGTSMSGGFVVGSVGIANVATDLLTSVYPSPFKEKVNVIYHGIESIEFFNVIGETVKTIEISSMEGKMEVDLESLPAGIYFYRTYKEGTIMETRKIVKAK